MTDVEELERRIRSGEDALVAEVARRWLEQARATDDPVACGNAMRWLAARPDDDSRALLGDAATWLGGYHARRDAHGPAAAAFAKAIDAYRGVAGAGAKLARAAHGRGVACKVLGRAAEALPAFEEALANADGFDGLPQLLVDHASTVSASDPALGAAQLERAIELLATRTDDDGRRLLAHGYLQRAYVAVRAKRHDDARADQARAREVLATLPEDAATLRLLGDVCYCAGMQALMLERFDDALRESALGIELVARYTGPRALGDLGQLRFQRAAAKVAALRAYRPALVELTAAVALLEQAVAATGAAEFTVVLDQARPLLVSVKNTVIELDRVYRPPPTARCAFCGCTSQHGRRMIPGLAHALICGSCYPRALQQVDRTNPRDPTTRMRSGTPRFRKGVTCDYCGDGYRRQFIVGEPHKICDECLDLAAETHA